MTSNPSAAVSEDGLGDEDEPRLLVKVVLRPSSLTGSWGEVAASVDTPPV